MTAFFFFAIIVTAVIWIARYVKQLQDDRDRESTRQTYEHIACPILVCSEYPEDDTVQMRAQAWRDKLRAAGNRYSETLPVVAYPFVVGASQHLGILTTWRQYRANCLAKEQQLFLEFEQEQAKKNQPLYEQFIAGQKINLNTL